MKRLGFLLLIASVFGPAASASALEFGVDIASQGLRSYTTSANPWSNNRTFGGLNIRGEVGLSPNWRIGFGWHYAGAEGELHGYGTTIGRHDMTLDGRYRYPLLCWLVPYARVGVGAARTHLTLPTAETNNWTPQVQAGLGLELLLPATAWGKQDSVLPAFGVFLEGGWQMVFDQQATLTSSAPLQTGVQPDDLKLGTLSLNGLVLRFGAAVRF